MAAIYPTVPAFVSTEPNRLGADALLYVLEYHTTYTVPDLALYGAEKAAVISIAARDVHPAVLQRVNRAIDLIAGEIRRRAAAPAELPPAAEPPAAEPPAAGGQRVRPGKAPRPNGPPSSFADRINALYATREAGQ